MKITNLCVQYQDTKIIDNVTLSLQKGTLTAILAPSGCGKTTLFDTISGLLTPHSGTIDLQGANVAYIFQEPRLFPFFNVLKNTTLFAPRANTPEENERRAKMYLSRMGLNNALDLYPSQLSIGMQQRVNIARALTNGAEVLLCDEPTSALDIENTRLILEILSEEKKEKCVLFATHNIQNAMQIADAIYVFAPNPMHLRRIFLKNEFDRKEIETLFYDMPDPVHK